ncbi:hypothetical protein TREMEDRAFT_25871 [Tremella mesenterica DSM 1558]|uniref:uncharacterized protein n=1 Tax=Tremella mesenterica (strain ATCC 24925 / CBS 8224 / DSM 1558 / NBRC 9311 / NRRL Y-6157 / RJB 2259-6 / UBC 559-6) TaxID=578456 RepID=UPI0003F4990C|nr:uncharacterized protein TREMEDRAFT_25871 [Tremella mesenterica DSM 1558]EIW72486.1 hypothetical protein TREMEDRAFT_25871 [Tremella mesenterica DSM 1558]
MTFSTRNAYYLRVSNYRVIPLFLYLDERHVDWMTDRYLQLVIAALQSKMLDLLQSARTEKKHKVYVERGDGYQYCYFLRSTTRTEVILLKKKTFSLRAPTPELPPPVTPQRPTKSSKRSRSKKTKDRSETPLSLFQDVQSSSDSTITETNNTNKDDEEEEEEGNQSNIKDWKPDVEVEYQGFGTSSLQLVLIIEPFPPLPPSSYAPPTSRLSSRSSSIVSSYSRSRTKASRTAQSHIRQSPSLPPDTNIEPERNLRNASRSVSAFPNNRNASLTPLRESSKEPFGRQSSTPFGNEQIYENVQGRDGRTPLFISRDTPFEDDEEDEEEHEAYEVALREGRMRLPSVNRPAGSEPGKGKGKGKKRLYERYDEEEEEEEDIPDGMERIGDRLMRNSMIEQDVLRVQGGWEEMLEGEESAVLGKEEPGD